MEQQEKARTRLQLARSNTTTTTAGMKPVSLGEGGVLQQIIGT